MAVRDWLDHYISVERKTALGDGIVSGLGGLAVMAVTFGFTYGSVWFISWSLWPMSSPVCFWLTAVLMVALFVGNLTTSREYLESYSFTTGTASDMVVSFDIPKLGHLSTINPIAPDSAHSFLKMLVSILYTGPRMIMGGIHNVRRWKRLRGFDVDGVAELLGLLLERTQKIAMTQVAEALPDRPLGRLLPQLAEVRGVLFLKSGEPGLSLSTDLRREMTGRD